MVQWVKNPSAKAGDTGQTPGWRPKIPHDMRQTKLQVVTTEPAHSIESMLCNKRSHCDEKQEYPSLAATRENLHAAT